MIRRTNYPHMARRCTFTLVIQTMVVLRALRGQKANHLKYLIPEVIEEKKALYVDGDTLFQNCPSKFSILTWKKNVLPAFVIIRIYPASKKTGQPKFVFRRKKKCI